MSGKLFPVKLDDNPVTFTCKSVTLREFKVLLNHLDFIRNNGTNTQTADRMLEAAKMVVVSWDCDEPLSELDAHVTPQQAMTIVGSALTGMKLGEGEQKK